MFWSANCAWARIRSPRSSVAATEVDGPVAESLRAVAARARLGADVAAGLRSVAAESSLSAHWERLAVFWRLAQTHGLAIATLMHTAQRDIVERERFSARVDAGMAGARTTAAVLAGLPVLGIGLGQLIGADPLGFLLSGGAGGWLLVVGVTLACCGLLWSDRITGAGVDMSFAAVLLAAALLIGGGSHGRGYGLRSSVRRRRGRVAAGRE